jgi:methoxymalonate biosynthesis acyl carrier protein
MTESVSATLTVEEIEEKLQEFLTAKTKESWDPDADLVASHAVSSLSAMEFAVFMEGTFDIAIEGTDLMLDNFRTVQSMSALVLRLRQGASGA